MAKATIVPKRTGYTYVPLHIIEGPFGITKVLPTDTELKFNRYLLHDAFSRAENDIQSHIGAKKAAEAKLADPANETSDQRAKWQTDIEQATANIDSLRAFLETRDKAEADQRAYEEQAIALRKGATEKVYWIRNVPYGEYLEMDGARKHIDENGNVQISPITVESSLVLSHIDGMTEEEVAAMDSAEGVKLADVVKEMVNLDRQSLPFLSWWLTHA